MPHIEHVASSLPIRTRTAPPKENQSCFRGMIIMLQNFGKTMDSFLVGYDPNTKGAARCIAQRAQDRAHGAQAPHESRPMSWSMLTAKRRNARERLLSKIPRAINRICRPRGRPVLTKDGQDIREAFKTAVLESLYKEGEALYASQSGTPLSAKEISLLIAKCNDLYTLDFYVTLDSLLRKAVRGESWSMSSILRDAHRRIFGKAVAAMEEKMDYENRDKNACNDRMWKLFDCANERAEPHVEILGPSFQAIAPALPAFEALSSSVEEAATEIMSAQELLRSMAAETDDIQASIHPDGSANPEQLPHAEVENQAEVSVYIEQTVARILKSGILTRKPRDCSREYMSDCKAFMKTRSDICSKVVARYREILKKMTPRNVEPTYTISQFKRAYAGAFSYRISAVLEKGQLALNTLPAVHDAAAKHAVSRALNSGLYAGEIPIEARDAFENKLVRICKEIDREIRMQSVFHRRPITTLASSRIGLS